MGAHTYRYEFWVPSARAKALRDTLYAVVYEGGHEPQRGPDVPSTPDSQSYATFVVGMDFHGVTWRRHLRKTDRELRDVARRHHGHVYRLPFCAVHVSKTVEWGPVERMGT
jgi:hypothetical protein